MSERDGKAPPIQLVGHTAVSPTTVNGRQSILIGLACFGLGAFMVSLSLDVLPIHPRSSDGPPWLLTLFGAIFAVPGLFFMLHGGRTLLARRKCEAERARNPGEPWRADFPWREEGIGDTQLKNALQSLFGAGFVMLFAAPFNYIAVFGAKSLLMSIFVFLSVDLFAAIFVIAFLYRAVRWLKYGTGRVRFRRLPYRLGETMEIEYVPARGLSAGRLACSLRCIREAYETRRNPGGGRATQQVVSYQHHCDTREIDLANLGASFDRSIALKFDLPPDSLPTRLSERPATYWELEVKADTPGIDLKSRFLVPVYEPA